MANRKPRVSQQRKVGGLDVDHVDQQFAPRQKLTKLEMQARREASQSIRVASMHGDFFGNSGGGAVMNAQSNFYSPQLSTDFLELPQSEREKRELIRFWYACFVPGAPVLKWDGTTTPVEDIRVGDVVPNGFGKRTKVEKTFCKNIDDDIVRMKVWGVQSHIEVTGNHPYYVLRKGSVNCKFPSVGSACKRGNTTRCKRHKCSGVESGIPSFVHSKDLEVGDYIVSPWMKEYRDCGLTRSQLRLLGYYAAEGSMAYKKAGVIRGVEMCFGIDELNTSVAEVVDLYKKFYGKKARAYPNYERNTVRVVCDGLEFSKLCDKYVGRGSHTKKLHVGLVHSKPEQILEFLGAYWNGDGCFTDNSYTADTVSYDLASQVFQMLRRIGIPAYVSSYDPYESSKSFGHSVTHYVSFPGRYWEEFSKYANFVGGKYTAKATRTYLTSSEYGFLHRIEKLEKVRYKGPVYNFEVRGNGDSKSYVAHGLATHNTHPIVGAAIDFHTDVPMSKIRLAAPKGKDHKRNQQILHFFENMCKRVRLFQTLYDITHEYWLHGVVNIFCEDHDMSESIPEELLSSTEEREIGEFDYAGRPVVRKEVVKKPKPDNERAKAIKEHVAKHYTGWQRLQILPPEQVKMEIFQYTDRVKMELIPSEKDRQVVLKAQEQDDFEAERIAQDIPKEIRDNLLNGQPIPLNTTPYDDFLCSSFCYHLTHKRSAYTDKGVSLLERCLRTLLYADKLRQAQTSIASRAMTPKRVIWADKMSAVDTDDLRDQVDQALIDPDFSIVTNFEVHWDEIGSRDRLLDLSTEYEITNKLLFIGLRITEPMLTGESTFSGERIHLDVMNTMYLLYRETLAAFVEDWLFIPVAEKKGFWEIDEYGNKQLLYPRLQFTRLALRDNTELQDFMFNLYTKGSMPIDYIYELLNIDSEDAHALLVKDMFTVKDSSFNEFIRPLMAALAEKFATDSDADTKLAQAVGLTLKTPEDDRFGEGE